MTWQEKAIAAIEVQQALVRPRSAPWMVGEQLKDICRREPRSAALLAEDLRIKEMSLEKAEEKIKAFADEHKSENFSCVTPEEAEEILRKFYGLPAREAPPPAPSRAPVDLSDFL